MLRLSLITLAAMAVAALAPPAAVAALGDTSLISRSGLFGPKGNGESFQAAMSADGRFVAFRSSATNLDPADTDASADVFVRDLERHTVTLVSRASGAAGTKGDGPSLRPAISADGRFVAFESLSTNLDPGDVSPSTDVYVRDLEQGTTSLVSRASGPAGPRGDDVSVIPAISADGRFVAFESQATNIDPSDTDILHDVFVRDLRRSTTTLVSRATGAAGAKGSADSVIPAISADGRFVAFASHANNLHTDDVDAIRDVFVRDLEQSTTTLVSRAGGLGGVKGGALSTNPAISADGRFVAFDSMATNLSADDGDAQEDVFVRDVQQATTTLVSRATGTTGANGNNLSFAPSISADGRFIAFGSSASNLDPADADGSTDVYVRDAQQATTTLLSRASGIAGAKGNGVSILPSISAGGRLVSFASTAANLHEDDVDASRDVFVRDVLGPPPVSTAPPRIAGQALAGGSLTCAPGTFANGPVTIAFGWRRDGADVASGPAYAVTGADVGHAITCVAVATNPGGTAAAESIAVVPTAPGPQGSPGPPAPLVALLAQPRLTARAGRNVKVTYFASAPARVTLTVLKGRRRILAVTRSARAGRNTLTLRSRRLRSGRYTLRLRAAAAGVQTRTDTGRLTLTRR